MAVIVLDKAVLSMAYKSLPLSAAVLFFPHWPDDTLGSRRWCHNQQAIFSVNRVVHGIVGKNIREQFKNINWTMELNDREDSDLSANEGA